MYAFYLPTIEPSGVLKDAEGFHAVRVLRLRAGDALLLLNGVGMQATARVESTERDRLTYKVLNQIIHPPESKSNITIAVAPPKASDRLEFLTEKLTELGIGEIAFFVSERSERRKVQLDKLHMWSVAALKQSKQTFLPKLVWYESLVHFLKSDTSNIRLLASLSPADPIPMKVFGSVSCIIGPEGDFTLNEYTQMKESMLTEITLGPSTLRTETACLVAAAQLQYINAQVPTV